MPDLRAIADASSALLTPIIGVVTTIILINQYRLEKRRWRLDLFEKRYAVYHATITYITSIMSNGRATEEAQMRFLQGSRDRALLFEKEIPAFLDELWNKSIEMETHQALFKDLPVGPERTQLVEAAADLKKQMPSLLQKASDLFGAYIRLTEK